MSKSTAARKFFALTALAGLPLFTALAPLSSVSAADPQLAANHNGEVNLYSYRQPFLIKPLLDEFTKRSGIKVNVVFAKKGMLEKIKAEGANTSADAILTADIGRLNDMVEAGLLQPVRSKVLNENVPPQYRHPKGLWYGLTTRARIFLVSKDRVKPGEITTYEDLASPALKGRVCIRSGKHVYNISLIASVIAHKGQAEAKKWLEGVKANLARRPQGNDRAQAKAVYQGVCDVAVANTYYMGKMATNSKKPEQKKWARALRVVFPNQNTTGAHVNVSGAAVTKYAKNRDNAIRLIEFLSGDFAQRLYAEQNFEYPVKAGVPLHPLVKSWGGFKADTINLSKVAQYRATASKIVDQVGFNQ